MRKVAHSLFVGFLLLSGLVARHASAQSFDGVWVGELAASGSHVGIVVHLESAAGGSWSGTLDVPDELAFGIPIDQITTQGQQLHLELKQLAAAYDGSLRADGQAIDGSWAQAGQSWPLTLTPGEAVLPLARPQEPKPPFPYDSEEVSYTSAAGSVQLAGTLTLPRTRGRHPAVLLISGSGAQDRDETLVGHKPFLVIADALTRRGLAVLRVDDRGVGGSSGAVDSSTTADFAQDALAGVAYLKSRADIDPEHVGLLGHSEGGEVAPLAAAGSSEIAFVVLLAAPGVPNAQVVRRQREQLGAMTGVPAHLIEAESRLMDQFVGILAAEPDDARAIMQMTSALEATVNELLSQNPSPDERTMIEQEAVALQGSMSQLTTAWYRYFLQYDPAPALRQLRAPVLALNGSLDLQVDPEQNLPAIAAALEAGDNPDFTIRELGGLNHLFQPAETGSPAEYPMIEQTFDRGALRLIGDWILCRTNASRAEACEAQRRGVRTCHSRWSGELFR